MIFSTLRFRARRFAYKHALTLTLGWAFFVILFVTEVLHECTQ